MVKKKKETLMDAAKDTVGIGIVSGVGLGAMGALGNVPGMPAQASGVTQATGVGLGLVGVGRIAKTGLLVANTFEDSIKTKGGLKKSNKAENQIIKKLLG